MMASPDTMSTVKPGFWCWSFHEFFAYKFGGNKLMQGRAFNRSMRRLRNAEGLWPLNRSIEPMYSCWNLSWRVQIWSHGVCFDREFEFGVFHDGKAAENCMIFPTSVFLIINLFPTFRKRIEQLLHQSLEPTLSVLRNWAKADVEDYKDNDEQTQQ